LTLRGYDSDSSDSDGHRGLLKFTEVKLLENPSRSGDGGETIEPQVSAVFRFYILLVQKRTAG